MRNILILASILCCAGCATTQHTVDSGKISAGTIPEVPDVAETSAGVPQTEASFLRHVAMPAMPQDTAPVYRIKSGKSDAVWVEGAGWFRGSLQDVYADLVDVQIMGPTHLTQDIVRDNYVQNDAGASYVMHVKMRYVLSVEFDLTVTVEPTYDGDVQTGWIYRSEKTSGTRFIQRISDTIQITVHDGGWFSVALQSLNEASQDKEDEARKHVEDLFKHWESMSAQR